MKKSRIIIMVIIFLLAGGLTFAWQRGFFKSIVTPSVSIQPETQFSNTKTPILGNLALDEAVTQFLLSKQEFSWKTGEGSSNFCVFKNLNSESDLFPIYIWIRCGEFKIVSGELKELSGTALPIKIDYPNELSYYDLAKFSFEAPRDGSFNGPDIERIFSENIRSRASFGGTSLNQEILEVAKKALLSQ